MTGPVMKPLAWLVEDFALYPREKVDETNVREIASALESGADVPPIVAEKSTGRIIDGFHRRRAWKRVKGSDCKVPVVLKEYATEADAFADAVRYNASHGRKLNSSDRTRAILRLREYGVDDESIRLVVRIPPQRVEHLAARIAVTPAGDPIPLKGGDVHVRGRIVTPSQVRTLGSRLGVSYGRLIQQIMDGLREDLLPEDDAFWEQVATLYEAIGAALETRGASVP